jgi:hypothetical protein
MRQYFDFGISKFHQSSKKGLEAAFCCRYIYYPYRSLTPLNPTANIETLAAGLLVLDGLARQS